MNNSSGIQSSERHYSLEPKIAWYWSARLIISVFAILGNGVVIFLIATKKRLQIICNWFVLSLAVSDFCVGLLLTPTGLVCSYLFPCDWRLQLAFYNFLLFASTLNLWAMIYDRHHAIVYPLTYLTQMTTRKITVIISLPWSTSGLVSFIRLLWFYDNTLRKEIESYYRVFVDLFFGLFSCLLLVIIFVRILMIVFRHSRSAASQAAHLSFNQTFRVKYKYKRERLSAKILGAVLCLFVVCYSLSIYISFCLNFKLCSPSPQLRLASILLIHLNCAINCFVYALLKKDFHTELRKLLKCDSELNIAAKVEGVGLNIFNRTSR